MTSMFVRIFLFVFVFTVEVRIHAESPPVRDKVKMDQARSISSKVTKNIKVGDQFEHVLQEPHNCILKASKCAVFNKANSFILKVGESLVGLGSGASVYRISNNEVILMAGKIWVRAAEKFTVYATHGLYKWEKGEALFEKSSERVIGTGISADLLMLPRGHNEAYELPIGFTNWMTPVALNGKAGVGIPQTTNLTWVVETWSGIYQGRAETLKKELEEYKAKWQLAIDVTAPWHKEMIDRRIAQVEAWRARQARLKALREAENARLRKLFRNRTYQ